MKTYDIINAGGHNRFMANGKIVSNSGWAFNPLNLPRINPSAPKASDALRNSLKAPKGHKVVVADLSGIELRMNMFLWKVPYAMKLFHDSPDKADLYKTLAVDMFHVPYDEVTKMQRQAAKAAALGCGYGVGSGKFKAVAKSIGGLDITDAESKVYVDAYRAAHSEVVMGWRQCDMALNYIHTGEEFVVDPWGLCHTSHEGIVSPKGVIRYPNLRKEKADSGRDEWVYGEGRHKSKIYGAKTDENVIQHLSRFVITDAAIEMKKRIGLYPVLEVYDELVYVMPDGDAEAALAELLDTLRTSPKWFPEIVLWAEGDIAQTYGAAK